MNDLEIFDSYYGVVVGGTYKGAYVKLENGVKVYAHKYANLKYGTKVLCTVLKISENYLPLVAVDSVLEYAA